MIRAVERELARFDLRHAQQVEDEGM